ARLLPPTNAAAAYQSWLRDWFTNDAARVAQQSARRGRDNQGFPLCFEHALGDVDPVRELPYRPAAVFLPHHRPQLSGVRSGFAVACVPYLGVLDPGVMVRNKPLVSSLGPAVK